MKQKCDVLIIGQGIAGSCLAYFLLQEGIDVQIIASPTKPNASKIAGGLMQRVSGQYLALPKFIQDHFDEAVLFYQSLNKFFNASIITKHTTCRILDKSQIKIWQKKRHLQHYQDLVSQSLKPIVVKDTLHTGIDIYDTYSVNTSLLLYLFSKYFYSKHILHDDCITEKALKPSKNVIQINNFQANYVIFCIGSNVLEWSIFNEFPIVNSKGEIISLSLDHHESRILQYDKWLIPIDKNLYKFGSTYAIDPTLAPTQSGYQDLHKSLSLFGYNTNQILRIEAGHRSTFSDYKPSMGFLYNNNRIGIFSGFSSKGFVAAPALAKLWSSTFPYVADETLSINRFAQL